ncbi:hypothetical protein E2C01_099588 [Portunus trituberculatus]|uniref:Uncharacterized protein n=1 Tax=Portunus trituberculatus TaxID=210409 RepID=A0A5B7KFR1_PORTR|nr:hypothetical protein [Portunus trituberculatus]
MKRQHLPIEQRCTGYPAPKLRQYEHSGAQRRHMPGDRQRDRDSRIDVAPGNLWEAVSCQHRIHGDSLCICLGV